eukprot:gene26636-20613_t
MSACMSNAVLIGRGGDGDAAHAAGRRRAEGDVWGQRRTGVARDPRAEGGEGAVTDVYSDLINIHEFQLVVDALDPPPEPRQPGEPGAADEGYETTESERQRRAEEEERLRREEEERMKWEAMMGGTVIVRLEDGSFLKLMSCRETDLVSLLLNKLQEQTGREPKDMRLVGRGYEMDPRRAICDFGVKVGAPWHLVPPGGPFAWDDGDILSLLWRDAPREEDDGVVSGWLQVQLVDGSRIQVFCEDDEPVEHIQRRMEEQVGIPPTIQRLVVHGREMNVRKTLRDYAVGLGPAGDVVDVMMRDCPAEPQFYIGPNSPQRHIM